MVKAHYKKMLILGLNRRELEHLKEGQPMYIKLDDIDPRMKGQLVVIIPGENDQQLVAAAREAERLLKDGQKPASRIILPN